MQIASVDEASAHLADLLEAAAAGEEVFITNANLSFQLVPRAPVKRKRQFGSARGLISMAPGFDEPLEEFLEYME